MRLVTRLAIVLGAVVIFNGGNASSAFAQNMNALVKASAAKAADPQAALKEYDNVVKEYQKKDPATAAEALYQRGLYCSGQDSCHPYGKNDADKQAGEEQAILSWKQLNNDFSDTPAGKKISTPGSNGESAMDELISRVDKRNSHDWKYQIMDVLVRITGRNPSFSYWFALILLAVLVKLILLPLTIRQYAGMREMQRMQPHIKELQKKYKGQELSQKQMELYKEHGVNPFASCVPTLLQLPFLILIYNGIRMYEYAFAHGTFLWVGSSLSTQYPHIVGKNLSQPDVPLLVIYTITNYVTMKLTPASDPQQQQQNTMAIMTSAMFFWMFLSYKWSSAFVLYWLALNGLSIWQQYVLVFKPQRKLAAAGGASVVTSIKNNEPVAGGSTNAKAIAETSSETPPRVRPRRKKK